MFYPLLIIWIDEIEGESDITFFFVFFLYFFSKEGMFGSLVDFSDSFGLFHLFSCDGKSWSSES